MRKIALGVSTVVCLAVVLVLAYGSVAKRGLRARSAGTIGTAGPSAVAVPVPPNRPFGSEVVSDYGKLPLAFEPNVGQVNPEAKFLARGAGYELFLTPKEAVFVLNTGVKKSAVAKEKPGLRPGVTSNGASVLRMRLLGA